MAKLLEVSATQYRTTHIVVWTNVFAAFYATLHSLLLTLILSSPNLTSGH